MSVYSRDRLGAEITYVNSSSGEPMAKYGV